LTHATQRALARADPTGEPFTAWQRDTARLIGRIFGFGSPYARAFNDICYVYRVGRLELSLLEEVQSYPFRWWVA